MAVAGTVRLAVGVYVYTELMLSPVTATVPPVELSAVPLPAVKVPIWAMAMLLAAMEPPPDSDRSEAMLDAVQLDERRVLLRPSVTVVTGIGVALPAISTIAVEEGVCSIVSPPAATEKVTDCTPFAAWAAVTPKPKIEATVVVPPTTARVVILRKRFWIGKVIFLFERPVVPCRHKNGGWQ
jgi:hypothetical protein